MKPSTRGIVEPKRLIHSTSALSLLFATTTLVGPPAGAQTAAERQDVMMVMEATGKKEPSLMRAPRRNDRLDSRVAAASSQCDVTPTLRRDLHYAPPLVLLG